MRKRVRQDKSREKRAKQKEAKRLKYQRYIRVVGGGLAFLICTVVPAYFFYAPSISVEIDTSLNPKNAAATLFRIKNQNVLFPIYDVNRGVMVNLMYDSVSGNLMAGSLIDQVYPKPNVPKLSAGESTAVSIPLGGHLLRPDGEEVYTDSDIELRVSYQTAVLRRVRKKSFRFAAHTGRDAIVHWFPKSLSEPLPRKPH